MTQRWSLCIPGERISLAAIEERHLPIIAGWPDNFFATDALMLRRVKQMLSAVRQPLSDTEVVLGVFLEGGLIGVLRFSNVSHRKQVAEIRFLIADPTYWGQGLGSDLVGTGKRFAFSALGVTRLTARVHELNLTSQRVLVKNRFVLKRRRSGHYRVMDPILSDRCGGLRVVRITYDQLIYQLTAEPVKLS